MECKNVKWSCKDVMMSLTRSVLINDDQLNNFADYLCKEYSLVLWDENDFHYTGEMSLMEQYVFVLDAMNFCFWPCEGLEYEHLAKGLKNALIKDPSCFDASRLEMITEKEISDWLQPFEVPNIGERVRLLRELGKVLLKKFKGKASEVILSSNNSAIEMVDLIIANFPGFRDSTIYKGKQVFFYKRAQILVSDIWAAHNRNVDFFPDIHLLTMFADYRVPQILRHYGVLQYNDDISYKVDNCIEIPSGSEDEIEIRACTVIAVERLCNLLKEKGRNFKVVEVDWILWQLGEKSLKSLKPHHRTRTIFY